MNKPRHREFKEYLFEKLKDPEMALAYLNEASLDEDQRVFLLALKNVLESHEGDMTAIAEEARISRQSLYKVLSDKGNPQLNNLRSILHTLGFEIAIQPISKK